jgi:hypothetical protein
MSKSLAADPQFVKIEFKTAAQARAAREESEAVLGVKLPKSPQEIELEKREAR